MSFPWSGLEMVGRRVLTAVQREGPWLESVRGEDELVERNGKYWTVIDRDTGDLIGSFGLPVQMRTRKQALDEAERFGSKWDWPVDREWREDA